MPNFSDSCNVKNCDKKFNEEEIIRAIRFNIAAEYEATQLYQQIAAATDNAFVKKVVLEIADEERVHAGELLMLLTHLCPNEAKLYEKGAQEVEEIIAEIDKKGDK